MKTKKIRQEISEPAESQAIDETQGVESVGTAEEDNRQASSGNEQLDHEINQNNDAEQIPEQGETEAHHQPHHQYQSIPVPPGYAIEPATGRIFKINPIPQYSAAPGFVPLNYEQPAQTMVPPQPTPEQAAEMAARQAAAQQRHGQIIHSVEQFIEGNATVSDVVKTLYVNTTNDDQLWKGVIVGAAAAVLLTSKPVRQAMGKTLGGVFPGLKESGSSVVKTEKN